MVHDYCERLLNGIDLDFTEQPSWHNKETDELIPVTDEIKKYLMSFMQFCDDSQQHGNFITEALEICMFDLAADNEGKQIPKAVAQSYGEVSPANNKSNYPIAICEKRASARVNVASS